MASRQRYQTDYAKSGRSTCRGCSKKISQGDLRLAMLVQCSYRDGLDPHWHHFNCFFMKPRGLVSSAILEGFGELRPQDQECIQAKLEKAGSRSKSNAKTKGKGKNKRNIDVNDSQSNHKRFKEGPSPFSMQSKEFWQIRDELSAHVNLAQLRNLLKANKVYMKGGEITRTLIPRVAKLIQFGVPPTCPYCHSKWPLRFCEDMGKWYCGAVLEYSDCPYTIAPKDLKTTPFVFQPLEKAHNQTFESSKFDKAIQRLNSAFQKARIPVRKPAAGKLLHGQKMLSGTTYPYHRPQQTTKGSIVSAKNLGRPDAGKSLQGQKMFSGTTYPYHRPEQTTKGSIVSAKNLGRPDVGKSLQGQKMFSGTTYSYCRPEEPKRKAICRVQKLNVIKLRANKSLQGQMIASGSTFSYYRRQKATRGVLGGIKNLNKFYGGCWNSRITSFFSFLTNKFSRANLKIKTALKYGASIVRDALTKLSDESSVLINPVEYHPNVPRGAYFHSNHKNKSQNNFNDGELNRKELHVTVNRHACKQTVRDKRKTPKEANLTVHHHPRKQLGTDKSNILQKVHATVHHSVHKQTEKIKKINPEGARVLLHRCVWEQQGKEKDIIPKDSRVAVHHHARKQLGKSARVLDLGGKSIFHAVLSKVNIARGRNSFYKMQVIQHGNKYYVAREHGRTGTTIGSHYLDTYHSASDAILAFQQLFAEKTGNDWDARGHFTKMPGRFEFVETRFLDSNKVAAAASDGQCQASSTHTTNTNLHSRVVDLVELIFNKKLMESAMLEMEIDLQKFPLGALTTTHVDKGYKTLSEISDVISGTTPSRDHTHRQQQLLTLSNKFFHIIPSVSIAVIDSEDKVAKKVELVDALRDMEVATRFLNDTENSTSTKSEAEEKYDLLRTKLEPLEVGGLDWKRLGQWVRNTKSLDNNRWGALKLVDAFAVSREGETNQFAKAGGKLHNHKLLWHGSRTTNYCGILSQGLRIAPPEAPCSGYRFGKGVYFADAVSKSANYCSTSGSSEMLIMACEVALGTEYEAYHDEYMERPRPGTHSTHAMGSTVPDPKADLHTVDGITIPTGKCKKNEIRSSCNANEFVVYNTNQVRIRYLLRLSVDAKKALPLRGPVLLASGRDITPPQGLVLSSD